MLFTDAIYSLIITIVLFLAYTYQQKKKTVDIEEVFMQRLVLQE